MWNNIFAFLHEHWEVILSVALFVLSFVLAILKKKNVLNKVAEYLNALYEHIPVFIDLVEKDGLYGVEKKLLVMDLCKSFLAENFGFYDFDVVSKTISDYIESVLTTPQKKKED